MPNQLAIATAAVVLLAGCGGADPQKTAQSLDSWSATVHTAANAVRLGWVPRRYGVQIRDRATAALNSARQSGTKEGSPAGQQAVDSAARRLESAVDSLSATVGS